MNHLRIKFNIFIQVHDIVNQDELYISSEEVVFKSILSWVKHSVDHRKESLPHLLACVRLPLLRPQFLSDSVATEELIRSSHKCRWDILRHLVRLKISFRLGTSCCCSLLLL